MLADTHVHFDDLTAEPGVRAVLDRASEVRLIIAVGGAPDSNRLAARLAGDYPRRIRAAVGYGRQRIGCENSASDLANLMECPGVVAVGETGLDLHREPRSKGAQAALFRQMLETARMRRLPVVVHSRDAEKITLSMLAEHAGSLKGCPSGPGVLHCFTGSRKFAARLLDHGFHISFSGILTFRNAGDLREVAEMIPADRLLIETDSPYLAPEPHRGRPNQPANVRRVAEALALIRKCSFEEIASLTAQNAERLFATRVTINPSELSTQ